MAVELKDVAIRYIVGDVRHIGFKDYVIQKLKGQYKVKEFWAVDGVSFKLEKGDFLGIIGKNGAGKSTLLKAVSGIIRPTRGSLKVQGSIAALLELGSGFDGEMTVKENTFLRGALLGHTREFMNEMYEEIINFAELKEFQDRPFRQLSSGMKSRLAFSIACLVQPDILILDEVLSVGDGSFKKKSEAKMREVIGQGAATLFVSHSLEQTKKLCNKVLWLDKGRQMAFGDAKEVCAMYEAFLKIKSESPNNKTKNIYDAETAPIFKNIYTPAVNNAEKRDYYKQTYKITDTDMDFFSEITSPIDLSGKTVLEISDSIKPAELILKETGAKKWVCIYKPKKKELAKLQSNYGGIAVFKFEDKPLEEALNEYDYIIYSGAPRNIPENFFDKFDVCISHNRFNGVVYMREVLDLIYKSLKKDGILFSKFSPVCSVKDADNMRSYEDYIFFMHDTLFNKKVVMPIYGNYEIGKALWDFHSDLYIRGAVIQAVK